MSTLGAYHRQRGIALVTAVLIVALATILAVDVGFKAYLDQRRSAAHFAFDQAFEIALGAEAWAGDVLRQDRLNALTNKNDNLAEPWATPLPPLPIDDGEIQGSLEDMQGRFNLNNLVKLDQDNRYVKNPKAMARFSRLLELVGLETKWAGLLVDYLDSDADVEIPDGAEDSNYLSLTPPSRTPGMPLTRTSEMLALPGFNAELYQKLEPYIAALPINTKVNICTAPGFVLDAFLPGQAEFSGNPEGLAKQRAAQGCFPDKEDIKQPLGNTYMELVEGPEAMLNEQSEFFRATIFVTIGTSQFTLYSLLDRNPNTNLVRPVLRSFGSP
jgi:general secretion pathway protein K